MEFNFERKLIDLIKKHPILYDTSHKQHKNNAVKKIVWENLGQQLDLSSKDVQDKWRNLKKRYSSAKRERYSGDVPKILNKKNLFIVREMEFFQQYCQDNSYSATDSNLERNSEPDTNFSNSVFHDQFNDTEDSLDIKPDSVLTDPLNTMTSHNQITSQRAPQSTCKCQNIDPFFVSVGEEFKMVASKYSLEAKISIMKTIKFYADKTRGEQ